MGYQKREALPEPNPYKPTTTTTPTPYKKHHKREALPEPNHYKPTTTATATPVPYKTHHKREAQPERQLHQRPTKDRRETPPSVRHQSQPVEAPATYQALSSASITICAAVAATIPMTAQPPSLSNVIFLLVPSLFGRYPEWYSVSEDMCAIDIF